MWKGPSQSHPRQSSRARPEVGGGHPLSSPRACLPNSRVQGSTARKSSPDFNSEDMAGAHPFWGASGPAVPGASSTALFQSRRRGLWEGGWGVQPDPKCLISGWNRCPAGPSPLGSSPSWPAESEAPTLIPPGPSFPLCPHSQCSWEGGGQATRQLRWIPVASQNFRELTAPECAIHLLPGSRAILGGLVSALVLLFSALDTCHETLAG